MPAVQRVHMVLPGEDTQPGEHCVHTVLPAEAEKYPVPHDWHVELLVAASAPE